MRGREFIRRIAGAVVVWPLVARAQQSSIPVIGYLGAGSAQSDAFRVTAFRQGLKEAGYVEGQNLTIEYRWAEDAVTCPFGAHAQQQATKIPRIGLLSPFSPSDTAAWHRAFLHGLKELGWSDGKNITIEYRYAEGRNDRLPALIADLQRLRVDVIVTAVTNDTLAAKNATSDIPIVMAAAGDPVATGIVQSLARPGGNVTGLSQMNPELSGKRLELLKEIAPKISSVAVLLNPDDPISALGWNEFHLSAQKLRMNVRSWDVHNTAELDITLRDVASTRMNALAIMPNPVFVVSLKHIADFALEKQLPSLFHLREFADVGGLMSYGTVQRVLIVELAARHRLPAVYFDRMFANGGLISYGVDLEDGWRRAASYIDRILRGEKPADMPVQAPTKYELVINLKTAKAVGLTIPPSVLARADEVIE